MVTVFGDHISLRRIKKSTHFVFEQIQTVYFIRECKSTLSELKYSPGDTTKVFESLGMGTHVWKALILLLLQSDLYVCLPHATFSVEDKKNQCHINSS